MISFDVPKSQRSQFCRKLNAGVAAFPIAVRDEKCILLQGQQLLRMPGKIARGNVEGIANVALGVFKGLSGVNEYRSALVKIPPSIQESDHLRCGHSIG